MRQFNYLEQGFYDGISVSNTEITFDAIDVTLSVFPVKRGGCVHTCYYVSTIIKPNLKTDNFIGIGAEHPNICRKEFE